MHDERHADDVVTDVIARFRNVFLPAGHLPDPLPQPLHLQFVPGRAGIARRGDVRIAQELRRLHAQYLRHLAGVPVEQVLVGQARRARHVVRVEIDHRFSHEFLHPNVPFLRQAYAGLPGEATQRQRHLLPG